MVKPIMLHVVRKTKVSTKHQIVHAFRSDWKTIYKISYDQSKSIFAKLNGNIETEAQFCKWVLDKFGPGIYYFRVWKKGQHGFRNFLFVELKKNTFRRLKPQLKRNQVQKSKLKQEIEALEKSKKRAEDSSEKENIDSFIKMTKEELEEAKDSSTKNTRYPFPYLSSELPVYSWHGYEEIEEQIQTNEMQRII